MSVAISEEIVGLTRVVVARAVSGVVARRLPLLAEDVLADVVPSRMVKGNSYPRILSGDEMLLELATAERGDTWLILDAGLSYGRSPDGTLYGEPAVHATLSQIVEQLDLSELW